MNHPELKKVWSYVHIHATFTPATFIHSSTNALGTSNSDVVEARRWPGWSFSTNKTSPTDQPTDHRPHVHIPPKECSRFRSTLEAISKYRITLTYVTSHLMGPECIANGIVKHKNISWCVDTECGNIRLHTHIATAASSAVGNGRIDAVIWVDDSSMVIGFGRWIEAIAGIELPWCLCVLSKFFHGHKEILSIPT